MSPQGYTSRKQWAKAVLGTRGFLSRSKSRFVVAVWMLHRQCGKHSSKQHLHCSCRLLSKVLLMGNLLMKLSEWNNSERCSEQ